MTGATQAYLEHVAFRVKDIAWHIRFFKTVLGWKVREIEGDEAHPRQVWIGGAQLIAAADFDGAEGRVNHMGVRCANVEAAVDAAYGFAGVTHLKKGRNWLMLPEGFVVEILPATHKAVATAETLHPDL
jgi:hypothetical protein